METQAVAPVIIIKRKKIIKADGHHGGAWKVAYADFVTAMMAFFMLMWLLNATTESQRKGIADYFSPTIPLSRISGGGDGAFGGDSIFSEETLARNGTGSTGSGTAGESKTGQSAGEAGGPTSHDSEDGKEIAKVESLLAGGGGDIMVMDNALRHIETRVTDEGLIIEIFDLVDEPLFREGSETPTNTLNEIVEMMVEVFGIVSNDIAVNGHTRARPVVLANSPVWELSVARAERVRRMFGDAGFAPERIERVSGYADRKPAVHNPMAIRNNRLELVLLRRDVGR
jgi:chemotaxis protein MotB